MTERRTFTREYKLEVLRLLAESGKSQAQVARELGLRSEQLRRWKRQLAQGGDRPLMDVFPGQGKQASQAEERVVFSGRSKRIYSLLDYPTPIKFQQAFLAQKPR